MKVCKASSRSRYNMSQKSVLIKLYKLAFKQNRKYFLKTYYEIATDWSYIFLTLGGFNDS